VRKTDVVVLKDLSKIVLPDVLPQIWIIDLDIEDQILHSYFSMIGEDEKQRASRFKFQKDYKAFVITRACLRILLADYLNMDPEELKFIYSNYGKPEIAYDRCDLQFNVSHSKHVSLIGISKTDPIGVDIEFIKFDEDLNIVARRFFSENEYNEFESLNQSDKAQGFFNCWTRKEAFIKAVGHGLSFPLKEFDVSLIPGAPARLKKTHFDEHEKDEWTMMDIGLPTGYVGAFAIKQKRCSYHVSSFKH